MTPHLSAHQLRTAAPRLLGAAAAFALIALGAACGSSSEEDAAAVLAEPIEDGAAREGAALVAAVGPSIGPVAPEVVIDETPPGLAVTSPLPGSSVAQSSWVFEGFTEPGATVLVGNHETTASESGRWSVELQLNEGANTHLVTTRDAAGNEHQQELTVNFEKPKPLPEKPKPVYEAPKEPHTAKPEEHKPKPEESTIKEPKHEFTAWTKFGICSTEPFAKTGGAGGEGDKETDVLTKFKGNGIPGTLVTVTSPFGGGKAEVDDSGYWWIKVEFGPDAPQTEFIAVVTSGDNVARFACGAI